MARITLGIATSHSPILILDGERWEQRARDGESLETLEARKMLYRIFAVMELWPCGPKAERSAGRGSRPRRASNPRG